MSGGSTSTSRIRIVAPIILAWACAFPTAPPSQPEQGVQATAAPTYVGSQSCTSCHPAASEAWSHSTHAAAERGADPTVPSPATDLPVVGLIGVRPVVQWLVDAGNGRRQVFDPAWDPDAGVWFSIHTAAPETSEWAHWTGRGSTWNTQCAACHNTRVTKGYELEYDSFKTTVVERGVGCEACHGPMSAHVAGAPAPVNKRMADTCGSCHARRTELTGNFEPGDIFLDHFAPALVDLTTTFRPDGGVAAEDFEWAAFLGSRMGQVGIQCADCHEPHGSALRAQGDALCATCHAAAPHDHHPTGVVSCVDCHMPTTTYMARDVRHDHGFTIPDPALAQSHGVSSACEACHTSGRGVLAKAAARWWGEPDRPSQRRARALGDARLGQGLDAVLAVVSQDPHPAWRAMALGWLEPWAAQPHVSSVLTNALRSDDALARFVAAGALHRTGTAHAAVSTLRNDPVRAVRVEASRVSRSQQPVDSKNLSDYSAFLEIQADQPLHLAEHAAWRLERGDTAGALAELRRANSWDPVSADVAQVLAVGLSRQGDHGAAADVLGETRRRVDDADLAFAHGLALAAADRPAEARVALATAVHLAPDFTRAWVNLALLLSQNGELQAALEALDSAGTTAPTDATIPYTRAALLRDAGRLPEARAAAVVATKMDPNHADAAALLRSLPPH